LNEGKLSLIVDLDQTLIHATVGPAIDEWINSQGGMPQVSNKRSLGAQLFSQTLDNTS